MNGRNKFKFLRRHVNNDEAKITMLKLLNCFVYIDKCLNIFNKRSKYLFFKRSSNQSRKLNIVINVSF